MEIKVIEPEKIVLGGLILKAIMEKNAGADPAIEKKLTSMSGVINVLAAQMKFRIIFEGKGGSITIANGLHDSPSATVAADFGALIEAAMGKRLVTNFLTGRLKIGGNPFKLLGLMSALKI